MLQVGTKVKMPDLSIDMPDRTFYQAAALETKKRIRKRTETSKLDYLGRRFKKYKQEYKEFRASKGRSVTPNLSFSGKMLGSMKTLVTNKFGKVVLSGEEALKARGNEKRGRIFFAFSKKDRDKVLSLVGKWMGKKNKLKR
jgi:hypothetical protein